MKLVATVLVPVGHVVMDHVVAAQCQQHLCHVRDVLLIAWAAVVVVAAAAAVAVDVADVAVVDPGYGTPAVGELAVQASVAVIPVAGEPADDEQAVVDPAVEQLAAEAPELFGPVGV